MRAVDTWHDVDAYRLLMEQVIAGNGLSAVVRLLSDLVALPATVADDEFDPLHAFAPRGRHLSADEAGLAKSTRSKLSFDLDRSPRASTAPPTARVHGTEGEEYVVAPIVLPSGIVGYVWVADPSGHVSTAAEESVAQAAAACAMEMVRQRAIIEGESRVRNSFLEDLLTGNVTSISATRWLVTWRPRDPRFANGTTSLQLWTTSGIDSGWGNLWMSPIATAITRCSA